MLAAAERDRLIGDRCSFATETVFSHPSKLALLERAQSAGYLIVLHIVCVPEDLAVARVAGRARQGGHDVPEEKIRERYRRLWALLTQAIKTAEDSWVYDNSSASKPFRRVAQFRDGHLLAVPDWPSWMPEELCTAGT